jgi:hypothetical protein
MLSLHSLRTLAFVHGLVRDREERGLFWAFSRPSGPLLSPCDPLPAALNYRLGQGPKTYRTETHSLSLLVPNLLPLWALTQLPPPPSPSSLYTWASASLSLSLSLSWRRQRRRRRRRGWRSAGASRRRPSSRTSRPTSARPDSTSTPPSPSSRKGKP